MSHPLAAAYARDVAALLASSSSTEESFYLAIRELWKGLLDARGLPFQVRTGTSEAKSRGTGVDRPDVAIYDQGEFAVVFGEVKLPEISVEDLAFSTGRQDQIGRYLAQTGAVLLCNIRAVGLVSCKPGYSRDLATSVPPGQRDLIDVVTLWSSVASAKHLRIDDATVDSLGDLLERAVTEFAPIGTPASLARILARQARRAKGELPEKFDSVRGLLEDYRAALGLSFEDNDGGSSSVRH